ncbi:MAG: Nramp family divalent metal transporter [Verrucomicrobia bacterium]|nr:Nramp family divalent metal transporter [Verrucomicrobiota bacterium]
METNDHNPAPAPATETGWRKASTSNSLAEVHRSIEVPHGAGFFRKMLAFAGPGYLVAVGYMDPGNWATDIAGGSAFGYTLLSVVLLSNLMAILLQSLAAKLGIVTGRDLAQACRDHYSKPVAITLWALCEVAICACDLAEVLGSAIALNLLFGLPLIWGVCLTTLDVFGILYLQNKSFRWIEALVVTLILSILACFIAEIWFCKPDAVAVLKGFIPRAEILKNPEMLYVAIGILGATVMPHNLYLHSSIIQTRKYDLTPDGKREAVRFAIWDSVIALSTALLVNAAILIVAAATFHRTGHHNITEIKDAHQMLSPVLGVGVAGTFFALALLASGQNSTLTGTLAGQIVMEGFLNFRMKPALQRFLTRAIAITPAIIAIAIYGDSGAGKLLVLSQVILSLQLSFAVIPLVKFTSERAKMGEFTNPRWVSALAWLVAAIIVALNVKFLVDYFGISTLLTSLFK